MVSTGEMTLNLCRLPKPVRNKSKVTLPPSLDASTLSSTDGNSTSVLIDRSEEPQPHVNLFQVKRVYGYFPFSKVQDGKREIAVSVALTILDSILIAIGYIEASLSIKLPLKGPFTRSDWCQSLVTSCERGLMLPRVLRLIPILSLWNNYSCRSS